MYYSRYSFLFDPKSKEPFKLSRSKIDLFVQCERCFYLDRRYGIKRPDFPAFTLNNAVDILLKKEFDIHRAKKESHPLMAKYGIKAIPYEHEKMDEWRHNFTGVQALHQETNFLVYGAIDDLWINEDNEIMVVDYKATSTSQEIDMDSKWKIGFKRQMEIYQWLLRHSPDFLGQEISSQGYFVYVNGRADKEAFDAKLEFDVQIIPHLGKDDWVDKTLLDAHKCLMQENLPKPAEDCEYCKYRQNAQKLEK